MKATLAGILGASATTLMGASALIGQVEANTSAAELQKYGPWGIAVIFGGAVATLFQAYKNARDSRDALAEKHREDIAKMQTEHDTKMQAANDRTITLLERQVDAITKLTSAMKSKTPSGSTDINGSGGKQ